MTSSESVVVSGYEGEQDWYDPTVDERGPWKRFWDEHLWSRPCTAKAAGYGLGTSMFCLLALYGFTGRQKLTVAVSCIAGYAHALYRWDLCYAEFLKSERQRIEIQNIMKELSDEGDSSSTQTV